MHVQVYMCHGVPVPVSGQLQGLVLCFCRWTPGSELKSSGLTSGVAPDGHTVSLALNPHILNQRPRADKMPQMMALKLCFLSLWNHWGTSLRKVWV